MKLQQPEFDFEKAPPEPEPTAYFEEKIQCNLCQDAGFCVQCERGQAELAKAGKKLKRK